MLLESIFITQKIQYKIKSIAFLFVYSTCSKNLYCLIVLLVLIANLPILRNVMPLRKTRPQSAFPTFTRYDLSTKEYRIPQAETLNMLRNSINQTFSARTSAEYTDIMQLTKSSQKYHSRIDRLCSKYCIKPQEKALVSDSMYVDSQRITKSFVRRKSKEKQVEERKNYLGEEIKAHVSSVRVSAKKTKTQEFFKLTCENLRKLQKRSKQTSRENINKSKSVRKQSFNLKSMSSQTSDYEKQKKSHPYLKIYQESQKEALEQIMKKNRLQLCYDKNYPALNEAQQWQKYQKGFKNIYKGIQRMRYVHSSKQVAKNSRKSELRYMQTGNERDDNGDTFYIT